MFIGKVPTHLQPGAEVLLPPEGVSFCQPCFPTCRLTEDSGAANTQDYRLCMAKDRGDFIASWAFYIHKVGIGALHQALFLVFPLLFWRGMKNLFERRGRLGRSSRLVLLRQDLGSPGWSTLTITCISLPSVRITNMCHYKTTITTTSSSFSSFQDRVSLYSLDCPRTHSVDQASLRLRDPSASAS